MKRAGRFVRWQARRLGLERRLHFIDGGHLERIVEAARGLVCVNSTSATLALAVDTPVCTIGEAIYDLPGLTHQRHLDTFWTDPTGPEPGLYAAFRRVLVDRCLVRGGLASESAVTILVESMLERLELNPATSAALHDRDSEIVIATTESSAFAPAEGVARRSLGGRSRRQR